MFITYLCYFSCNNNINSILSNTSISAKDGDNINVLIIKEYDWYEKYNHISIVINSICAENKEMFEDFISF